MKAFVAVAAAAFVALSTPACAQEEGHEQPSHFPLLKPQLQRWTFAGPFGKFDPAQLQRGYQVYKEVCAACHSMELLSFRNLAEEGGPHFSEAEARALAAEYQITAGPDENGDMFERPGVLSDRFPSPFPNAEAAAAANGGAAPPDLSLIAKARGVGQGIHWTILDFFSQYQEAGVDYLHALLTGYDVEPTANIEVPEGTHYNPYFVSGVSLKMPPPLSDGLVTYADGSPETVDQYARDVSAFLMWGAEPHLVDRKRLGFMTLVFLGVFAVLMYLTKQRVWSKVAH
jgi:ubiquinol-cytochrome c reductase cytochrome c1 subunit